MMGKVKSWEEVSREEVFRQHGRGVEKVVFRLPKGNTVDFYLYSRHQSIACLALTEDQKVILVRQYRPGPKKILWELPGGGVKVGEERVEAMERELLEETGYRGTMKWITTILPDAYSTGQKNALVAVNCVKVAEPKEEDNGETVEVVLLSLDEFRAHLRTGQMTDVEISYLCLDYLKLL